MRFKGILLDLDNTIYDYDLAHNAAFNKVIVSLSAKHKISSQKLKVFYSKARDKIHHRLSMYAAGHNRMLYFQEMFELLNINSLEYSLQAYNIYWNTFLKNMFVREGVYEFLRLSKNYPLCIVSDLTAVIQHRKIKKLNLCNYVNFLVSSEEAGHEKPRREIFDLALQKLKLFPNEVCMIGDNFDKDIKGAVSLGIKSFWLTIKNEDKKKKIPKGIVAFSKFSELPQYFL